MGQYYHPIILSKNNAVIGHWNPHKTGNGAKLTEHSYVNNSLCNCVENYLLANGGARLVWAGDYADPERIKITKEEAKKVWQAMVAEGKTTCSFKTFWKSGDEALYKPKSQDDNNLYDIATGIYDGDGNLIHKPKPELPYNVESNEEIRFIVNDDKKEFLDLWNVNSVGNHRLHPLPLLTCEGNQRGGGDYYGLDESLVGTWARDFIRITPQSDYDTRKWLLDNGYKEIAPDFVETYNLYSEYVRLSRLVNKAFTTDSSASSNCSNSDLIGAVRYGISKVKGVVPRPNEYAKQTIKRYIACYDTVEAKAE